MNQWFILLSTLAFCLLLTTPGNRQAEASSTQASASPQAQISTKFVQEPVFNSRVYIIESGQQNPKSVILIHGLGDMGTDTWKTLLPQLALKYHVIAFDLPGFGLSEKKNALYSPGNYANFVKWVVDNYAKGIPDIIGHSMGGAIAIAYAGTYPDRIDRLVLADVAGVLHKAAFTNEILQPRLSDQWPDIPSGPLDWIDSMVRKTVMKLESFPLETDMPLESEQFRGTILGGDPTKIAAMATIQANIGPLLPNIQAPTLLLWGDEDKVTPYRTAILLKGSLKNARLVTIPGAGHVPMLENPQIFNYAVLDFLGGTKKPNDPAIPLGTKSGSCINKTNASFRGSYKTIRISNCSNVKLIDIHAESVEISDSSAIIENTSITGPGTGLSVRNSRVTATALAIDADNALVASNSTLDLAGASLKGRTSALSTPDKAIILFSASQVQSPKNHYFLHGSITFTPQLSY